MIVTFYSYKGGVGRSMAVANVADLLARSGLRVLIVDFDLEAPGLEHFFPDQERVQAQPGLLDLLLSFKYSMSLAAGSDEDQPFRQLDRFIATVYPPRESGGCLDILPAGQRHSDDQLVRYGVELRRFDWLDFYFTWSGELFFEWLRRTLHDRYDIVLVDSRTGVTEMGGICAYQLADVVVALCAPNLQNLDGTAAMVKHFQSPQVLEARHNRPINVLVVPARVEQRDRQLRDDFERDFNARFEQYAPEALGAVDLRLWDLQIPYEPRYAFNERVVTDPARVDERRQLADAYSELLEAIAQLAPTTSPVAGLRHRGRTAGDAQRAPIETRYDPQSRFARADVFISAGHTALEEAHDLVAMLRERGITTQTDFTEPGFEWWSTPPVFDSRCAVIFLGPLGDYTRRWGRAIDAGVALNVATTIVVLLQGVAEDLLPSVLRRSQLVDWRDRRDDEQLLATVVRALSTSVPPVPPPPVEMTPYVGLRPFGEADAPFFFGRHDEVERMVDELRRAGHCCVSGPAGSGKTSVVRAGLLPRLRAGAVDGSEGWPIVYGALGSTPLADLSNELARALDRSPRGVGLILDQFETAFALSDVERDELVATVTRLVTSGRVATVVVVRDDFLSAMVGDSRLARISASPVHIAPLAAYELRTAIEHPVQRAGYAFEPGLVDELVGQVAGQPGSLPLLQAELVRLWDQRKDGYLTWNAYLSAGGIAETVGRWADTIVDALSENDQAMARRILLRLVQVGEGRANVAVRRGLDDLVASATSGSDEDAQARRVIERLSDGHIIVLSASSGRLEAALAHEVLAQRWPRLQRWVSEEREALESRVRLERAVSDWQQSGKRTDYLLTPRHVDSIVSNVGYDALTASELEFAEAAARRRRRELIMTVLSWVGAAGLLAVVITLVPGGVLLVGAVAIGLVLLLLVRLQRWWPTRRDNRSASRRRS